MKQADLEYIRILNDMISGGIMRIAELKSKAYPGAITYDDIGGSHSSPSNKLEEVFCKIDDEEMKVNKLIDKRYKLKSQALLEIQNSNMECAARHILYLRYLSVDPITHQNLEWQQARKYIKKYHNISERHIYRLHHVALGILGKHNI